MHPCERCAFKIQSKIRVQIIIRIIRVIRVQKISCSSPQWAPRREQRSVISVRSVCKRIFVTFALLPPYGQWAYGESRVQNISWEHRNSSLVNSTLRPAATIQHSTFKTQHCAPRLRVKRYSCYPSFYHPSVSGPTANLVFKKNREWHPCSNNIRVIRVITSLLSVVLRRISCSKEYIKGYALNWVLTKYILNDI